MCLVQALGPAWIHGCATVLTLSFDSNRRFKDSGLGGFVLFAAKAHQYPPLKFLILHSQPGSQAKAETSPKKLLTLNPKRRSSSGRLDPLRSG